MKLSKREIEELREKMKINGDACYGTEEVVFDTVGDILLQLGSELTYADEIGLTDGDTEFSTLDDFIREFWDKAVDLFCNFVSSEEELEEN